MPVSALNFFAASSFAGVGGGDLVSFVPSACARWRRPMPRVPPVTTAIRFGHFFPPVGLRRHTLSGSAGARAKRDEFAGRCRITGALDAGHRTAIMKPFNRPCLGAAAGTHARRPTGRSQTLPPHRDPRPRRGTRAVLGPAGPPHKSCRPGCCSHCRPGAWIDRMPRRTLLIVALGLGLAASVFAVGRGPAAGHREPAGRRCPSSAPRAPWVYVLTSISLLPALVPPGRPVALQCPSGAGRAPIVSLAATLRGGPASPNCCRRPGGMPLAALGAALGLGLRSRFCRKLPPRPSAAQRPSFVASIQAGAPLRGAPRAAARASASARSSGNFALFSPLLAVWGAVGVGPARPRPGT